MERHKSAFIDSTYINLISEYFKSCSNALVPLQLKFSEYYDTHRDLQVL